MKVKTHFRSHKTLKHKNPSLIRGKERKIFYALSESHIQKIYLASMWLSFEAISDLLQLIDAVLLNVAIVTDLLLPAHGMVP